MKVDVDNRCKMRHPVEKLVDQLVAGDLPWSRATLKLGLMITSLSCLQVGFAEKPPTVFPGFIVHYPSKNTSSHVFM